MTRMVLANRVIALMLTLVLLLSAFAIAEEAEAISNEVESIVPEQLVNLGNTETSKSNADTNHADGNIYMEPDDFISLEDSSISCTFALGEVVCVIWENPDHNVISYSSSKKKVAQVYYDGPGSDCFLKMNKEGKTTITAKMDNGNKLYIYIQVVDVFGPTRMTMFGPNYVEAHKMTFSCPVGGQIQFSELLAFDHYDDMYELFNGMEDHLQTDVIWQSSKSSVASVDPYGLVTAHKEGKAKITLKARNGLTRYCTIKVGKNKADNLYDKPSKAEINELQGECALKLKSMERKSNGDILCEAYFINGTSEKMKYINGVEIGIFESAGDCVMDQYFGTLKVNCKKKSYSKVSFTFRAERVYDSIEPYCDAQYLDTDLHLVYDE